MTDTSSNTAVATNHIPGRFRHVLMMLWADKFAFAAALFLLLVVICAILGPALLEDVAGKQNLRARNAPPFLADRGFLYILGG
ncbi:MAG: ABC transporter permease, partial [Paracoccus sp. (in: a-proteobacteria)]